MDEALDQEIPQKLIHDLRDSLYADLPDLLLAKRLDENGRRIYGTIKNGGLAALTGAGILLADSILAHTDVPLYLIVAAGGITGLGVARDIQRKLKWNMQTLPQNMEWARARGWKIATDIHDLYCGRRFNLIFGENDKEF